VVTLAQGDWVGASAKWIAQDFLWIISALWSFSCSAKYDDNGGATDKNQVPPGRKGKGLFQIHRHDKVHCRPCTWPDGLYCRPVVAFLWGNFLDTCKAPAPPLSYIPPSVININRQPGPLAAHSGASVPDSLYSFAY